MVELAPGVRRATLPLPLGIDHVHVYFLRSGDGSWTLVDTGLGLADPESGWAPLLAELDGPVERIVVTHFHPDHVGGAADVAALTGATVFQGALDYAQCLRVWGGEPSTRVTDFMHSHGYPAGEPVETRVGGAALTSRVRMARDPVLLTAGDHVDGWEVLQLPGHADGHIVLYRDGTLVAGDVVLAHISPAVGLYPDCRPDPLADYLGSLARLEELAPRIAFAGHHEPIADPAARARDLRAHHGERLERTAGLLGPQARNAYAVSLDLFPEPLPPGQRRFALAETLAHLEYLVARDGVVRVERGEGPLYARR